MSMTSMKSDGFKTSGIHTRSELVATLSQLKKPASAVIQSLCDRATYATGEEYEHLRALIKALRSLSTVQDEE